VQVSPPRNSRTLPIPVGWIYMANGYYSAAGRRSSNMCAAAVRRLSG
jgi:hypothetical protein